MREKVRGYILDRKLLRAGDRVAVAVSGGADSVALLRVLIQLRSELGIVVSVAHFNHGLRGEASEADDAFVAELAKRHDLEFFSGRGDVHDYARTRKLGLEVAARDLRYRWLASVAESNKLNEIATGHTLDDQAETVLLKFLRGAGTRGLAGIYPVLECLGDVVSGPQGPNHPTEPRGTPKGVPLQVRIIRPLLGVTRDEVEQYLTAVEQPWREDESNLDHRFARNRVRHELLPLLQRDYNPNIRQVLSDAAEIARAEEEYWQTLVDRELATRPPCKTEIPPGLKPSADVAGHGTAKAMLFQTGARAMLQSGKLPSPAPCTSATPTEASARKPANRSRLPARREIAALCPRGIAEGRASLRMAGGTPAWISGIRSSASRTAVRGVSVHVAGSGRGPHHGNRTEPCD